MKVPFLDLKAQYRAIAAEMDLSIRQVVESTEFVGGRALTAFEEAFARAHGVKHCIGVGNGTDALFVILKCLGIGPGDTVATTAQSFIASAEAVTMTGARPLFVDVGEDFVIEAPALDRALGEARRAGKAVRAVMPVHLYGRVCDMTAIGEVAKRHDARVVEDCAQAHLGEHAGRKVGTFGAAGAFSFYPGKNLGAYGDAGAIVTNDDALAEKMRRFANHGRVGKYDHIFEGINSRLDNLQAAVLLTKLPHLQDWTRARIARADRYRQLLTDLQGVVVPPSPATGFGHVYHLFVVRLPERDRIRAALKEAGVDTGVHYPHALPNLPPYQPLGAEAPRASAFAAEVLSLPMFAELTDEQTEYVAQSLRRALS